ncbi:GNAT family N-acetyltransferase [Fictibacillus sp. BK138]|uniref:GNAT family N-acetyltransferase n=1 Tax=Fictibacillus sp. BK138 TaxID=2512121 RepID=UPI001029A71C|nr:GNAT family N-acetyltransferase [Fictibacillus sp. BK138]RZT15588.1 acetyltransferase (GNAT) family protein [Fictibacillus sp. BK138]
MYTIKKLDTLTLAEVVETWNEGFKGYYSDATMTVDSFVARMVKENLKPSLSIVAFDGEKPVGILLSGVQDVNGSRVSWNGGTAVIPDYRKKGVGLALVEASLKIYEEEKVDVATLEAFSINEKAINLYKKMGYEVIDSLNWMQNDNSIAPELLDFSIEKTDLSFVTKTMQEVQSLPIYNKEIKPWQTEWFNLRQDGELLLVLESGTPIGYFLYRHVLDQEGKKTATVLYQAEVKSGTSDEETIIKAGLKELLTPLDAIKRMVVNLPSKKESVTRILKEIGFTVAVEQVLMTKPLKKVN